MGSRLFWRRSLAAAGYYSAAAVGFVGTVVAARELGVHRFGLVAIVLAATGFLQTLLDISVEEAVLKYGFRYIAGEDWGRLRRLFTRAWSFKLVGALLGGLGLAALAPFGHALFHGGGLEAPLLVAGLLPVAQAPEGLAAVALMLHGRYDVRGGFLFVSAALRTIGLAVGARYGVLETVIGVVAAQSVATAAIGIAGLGAIRRFPRPAELPLGEDRWPVVRFFLQSSLGTGVVSLRALLAPLVLGILANPTQVGLFRTAQAPQTGFAALSAPARLILLTEQTRDWEQGRLDAVFAGIRRFTLATSLAMVAVLPPLLWFTPDLIRVVYKPSFLPATNATRLILGAAALQLIVGWTKSLPIAVGKPWLRILAHGVETVVLLPLIVVLGAAFGATGAAEAVLASTAVFVALWALLVVWLRRESLPVGRREIEAVPL